MSAEGLVPAGLSSPEFSTCRSWSGPDKEQEPSEKMVTQPSDGGSAEEPEEEPEPPPAAVQRKVSFADSFGLDLVSVKEFHNQETSGLGELLAMLGAQGNAGEEFYLSCLFTCPASDLELKMRLYQQKLELESIELLPGSTTIRGIVRVLHLCFHKVVYVRITQDGWQSHFDLLAEFVSGSSDGQTDRFSFQLVMTPPFGAEGARVEFCLRYESAAGTFWANNRGMNYVLFCHQRRKTEIKEEEERDEEKSEDNNQRGFRSCLKTNSEKIYMETHSSREISGDEDLKPTEDLCKPLVDHRKKRRTSRMEHAGNRSSQKDTEPLADISHSDEGATRLRAPDRDAPSVQNPQEPGPDTPPVMRCQIPQPSLDCSGERTSSARGKRPKVCKRTLTENHDDGDLSETSACDGWRSFLNGSDKTLSQRHAGATVCSLL